ncbi:hypothetical protein vBRpoSV10_225 [Ruegeria phage vB_RpoS-V10]|nr:hypothetical protein vBRpoSV10_225 [Ruegeria phage vB_RpoS-V10]
MKKILLATAAALMLTAGAAAAGPSNASVAMSAVELFDAGTAWSVGGGIGLGGDFEGDEAVGVGAARHFDGYSVYIKAGAPLNGASLKDTNVFVGVSMNF